MPFSTLRNIVRAICFGWVDELLSLIPLRARETVE